VSATGDQLILARHGASEWSGSGRYQGHGPVALSALGRRQAEVLADELAERFRPARIVSSDLPRAAQTGAVVAERCGADLLKEERLREIDCGWWAGLTEAEISQRDPSTVVALARGEDPPRGGAESRKDMEKRVCSALLDLNRSEQLEGTVVVAHAYVIRAAIGMLVAHLPKRRDRFFLPVSARGTVTARDAVPISLPLLGSYCVLDPCGGGCHRHWKLRSYNSVPQNAPAAEGSQWLPTL
jgi:glucosyl-3-phosphoglycerate phosphatase